jgi:O-antigen/teichoic acid export membrane protein
MRKHFEPLFAEIKSPESSGFRITSQAFIIRLIGLGFIFLNQALLARLMGAKGYGNYTVIFTWLNFFTVFSMIGFDTSVLRFYPSLTAKQQWNKLKGFLRFTKRIIFLLSLLSSVILLLFLLYSSNRYSISFSEALFWAVFLLPFLAYINYYSAVLRALHKIKTSLLPFYILIPASVSIACAIYYKLNNNQLKVDAAMFTYLCCAIGVCLFISARLRKELSPKVRNVQPEYEQKKWFAVSVTLFTITIITLVLKRVDILFMSYYFGNTHAGIYAVASMISSFVPFGLSVVDYVFAPRISELYESHQHEKLQQMISNTSKIILIITLPITFVMIVFGKFILQIFGTAFIASYLPLIILTAGQFANAWTGMVAAMMTMTGNQRIFLLIYVLAGILDVILNFILVPSLGMIGAAISSAVSLAALNLTMYFIVKKKLHIKVSAFIF